MKQHVKTKHKKNKGMGQENENVLSYVKKKHKKNKGMGKKMKTYF